MKRLLLTALIACSVQAATINLTSGNGSQSGSGMGNEYNFSIPGVSLQVTAFALLGGSNPFTDAQVGQYSPGLGVCNSIEGVNCGADNHQADNSSSVDYFLLQFSTPVQFTTLIVNSTSGDDRDIMYYLGNNAGAPSGSVDLGGVNVAGLGALGFGSAITSNGTTGTGTFTHTLNTASAYNMLLIGAPTGQTNDYWKFKSVSFDVPPPSTDVPEPTSMALMGSALLGLGLIARRRTARK